jgi:hypothetical protein
MSIKILNTTRYYCPSPQLKVNSIIVIEPISGYRKVGMKIDDDIKKEYSDEEDNLCYKKLPLEESNSMLNEINFYEGKV